MNISETNKLGDRIELVAMGDDPSPIGAGKRGTVDYINNGTYPQLGVKWDNGRTLLLVPPVDRWRTLTVVAVCDTCADETGATEAGRQCGRDLEEEISGAGICAGTYRRAER